MRRCFQALLMLLLVGAAAAQTCTNSATVRATAISTGFTDESTLVADAVQSALNEAIMQVRGVYVTSSSVLWEDYRTTQAGALADVDLQSGFSTELSSRFSGYIESFEIVDRQHLGGGALEVSVIAAVCLDERIAIGLPAGPARNAILNSLIDDITAAGWQVIYDAPDTGAGDHEMLEFTLATGVTYVAQGSLSTSLAESHGMTSATVTLTMNLLHANTMQLAHGFTATHTGVGPTTAAAVQMAGDRLGTELARDWNRVFLEPEQRSSTEFVFRGLRRAATRHSLVDIVAGIPGVLRVDIVSFDAQSGEVSLAVEMASDPCVAAREVPGYRRVLTELVSCDQSRTVFRVRGD